MIRHCSRRVVSSLLVLLVAMLAIATAPPAGAQATRATDHVVLVSLDGFDPTTYLDPARFGVDLPTLKMLKESGSWADGVEVQYPSMTYPGHTSIVTGVHPARHGVYQNTQLDPVTSATSWYFESRWLKVPAIWDIAEARGLSTAGVSWPVSVGAKMRTLYPESNQAPRNTTWLDLARQESTPGLVDAVVQELGGFGARDNLDPVKRDRFAAAMATHIIRSVKPNLIVIHLMQSDDAQHNHGPRSAEAKTAFSNLDRHLAEIVRAVDDAGIRARTTFVVTGDHGFYAVHSMFQPNVLLRDMGLLSTDATGRITEWKAQTHGFAIKMKDAHDSATAELIVRTFTSLAEGQYKGLFRVVTRAEMDALAADPDALITLEPVEGYTVQPSVDGNAFLVPTTRRGQHGYLPSNPQLRTGLILTGAGIRAGIELPFARQNRHRADNRTAARVRDDGRRRRRDGWRPEVERLSARFTLRASLRASSTRQRPAESRSPAGRLPPSPTSRSC
ncbi:MAG: ectonucleotide pyrophosphatase/phosphodiesterase [Vicinamibacterales bacterium]